MTIDVLYDRIGSIVECACSNICKFREQYKDPDELEKNHCNRCVLFDKAEALVEELEGEDNEF